MLHIYRILNAIVFCWALLGIIGFIVGIRDEKALFITEIVILVYSGKWLFDLFFRHSNNDETLFNLWVESKKSALRKKID